MYQILWLHGVVHLLVWGSTLQTIQAILPQPPIQCDGRLCTLSSAYGIWGDRTDCQPTSVVYPTTQEELRLAVAYANKNKLKVSIVSKFSHSATKLACPSTCSGYDSSINTGAVIEEGIDEVGEAGLSLAASPFCEALTANTTHSSVNSLLISTAKYDSNIEIDSDSLAVTADAGVGLRDLIDKVEEAGFSLVASTYWEGVSVAGVISSGAHGSSLWGNGGAVHDQVIGISLIVPASESQGYAKIIQIGPQDELLNAARVSLGLLGVISKVSKYQF